MPRPSSGSKQKARHSKRSMQSSKEKSTQMYQMSRWCGRVKWISMLERLSMNFMLKWRLRRSRGIDQVPRNNRSGCDPNLTAGHVRVFRHQKDLVELHYLFLYSKFPGAVRRYFQTSFFFSFRCILLTHSDRRRPIWF